MKTHLDSFTEEVIRSILLSNDVSEYTIRDVLTSQFLTNHTPLQQDCGYSSTALTSQEHSFDCHPFDKEFQSSEDDEDSTILLRKKHTVLEVFDFACLKEPNQAFRKIHHNMAISEQSIIT